MIKLANLEWIFSLIILLIVFHISIMICGIIQTYITARFGDTTSKNMGYGQFNPLLYFDPWSIIFLGSLSLNMPILFYFGNQLPIDNMKIQGPYRSIKLLIIYSTEFIVNLILAFIALVTLVAIFGQYITVKLTQIMFYLSSTPLKEATFCMPEYSSLMIVFALILTSFVYLNIFIAAISLIINGFRYVLIIGFDKGYRYIEYADYILYFGTLIGILFFSNLIRFLLFKLIIIATYYVTLIFGIL